jgi:hypothetical protein
MALRYRPRQSPPYRRLPVRRSAARIENEQYADLTSASGSRPQLFHILDLGRGDLTDEWALQARLLLEQLDSSADLRVAARWPAATPD